MSAQRIPWRFRDPVSGETYYLPVNPSADDGSHGISKQTKYVEAASTYMTASNSLMVNATVVQESPNDTVTFAYSGTLYTKGEYDRFVEWSTKKYPWELRDDLGRLFEVYITGFTPVRQRSAKFRWKHTYVLSGMIVRELGL